ncbi:hypothetical protein N9L68_02500, partial [bacterium]|nr:hypothetical protein [bacterium]
PIAAEGETRRVPPDWAPHAHGTQIPLFRRGDLSPRIMGRTPSRRKHARSDWKIQLVAINDT